MNNADSEIQEYRENMKAERGCTLEFHKILAAEDFAIFKSHNGLLPTSGLNPDSEILKMS